MTTTAFAQGFGPPTAPKVAPPAQPITFEQLAAAQQLRLGLEQRRRVLADGGASRWISTVEHVEMAPDVSGEPRFALTLDEDSLVGMPPAQQDRLRQSYRAHAGYLFLHAGFRVEDPVEADRAYVLLYLDSRRLLGRPVHRVAVLPRVIGRNTWLLEVDDETGYPLRQTRYDAAGELVATIEVIELRRGNRSDVTWWTPTRSLTRVPTLDAAVTEASRTAGDVRFTFPEAADLPRGFALREIVVSRHDLRPELAVVLTYSDGVDTLFVVEKPGVPSPGHPAPVAGSAEAPYAIFVFEEPGTSQYWFYRNDVEYAVIGNIGSHDLASVAVTLLEKSLR